MFTVEVKINDSFYRKTDPNTYIEAINDVMEYTTSMLLEAVKDEAPVRTGNLRDGHYMTSSKLTYMIGNNVEYAPYVIYGTSRQAPNNYPSRAINRMNITGTVGSLFSQSLITRGVK